MDLQNGRALPGGGAGGNTGKERRRSFRPCEPCTAGARQNITTAGPPPTLTTEGTTMNPLLLFAAMTSLTLGHVPEASAQVCKREGNSVTCDDGRRGIRADTAIIWSDGTRSHSATPHPSVIIGNKSSLRVGPGVFVGTGKGTMPLDDPNAPNKTRCAIVDGVSYC
jgi:hypothetical protein